QHELAALLRLPLPDSAEAQRSRDARVNELTQEKQRLERDLAARLPEADRQRRLDRLGPDDLVKALPGDTAFVDLLRYRRVEHGLAVQPHGPFLLEQLASPGRFARGREKALALGGVAYSARPAPRDTPLGVRGPQREGAAPAWAELPGSARELRLLRKLHGG